MAEYRRQTVQTVGTCGIGIGSTTRNQHTAHGHSARSQRTVTAHTGLASSSVHWISYSEAPSIRFLCAITRADSPAVGDRWSDGAGETATPCATGSIIVRCRP